jgi:hypothetical protein
MSIEIKIHLSEQKYDDLQSRAVVNGVTPERMATELLEKQLAMNGNVEMHERVPGLIRRNFGSIDLGKPTGSDNESIDADLAKEFGRGM